MYRSPILNGYAWGAGSTSACGCHLRHVNCRAKRADRLVVAAVLVVGVATSEARVRLKVVHAAGFTLAPPLVPLVPGLLAFTHGLGRSILKAEAK